MRRFTGTPARVFVAASIVTVTVWLDRSDGDPTAPDAPASPMLQQLSDETQRVYTTARRGMVRVQFPMPAWLVRLNAQHADEQRQFMIKWGQQLDPRLRDEFLRDQARNAGPTTARATTEPGPVERRGVVVATGLLVDVAGHAVIPFFVDRSDVGRMALPATTPDDQPTTATFVGSDRKTNLTVIQLANTSGLPVTLARGRPADGSLAVVISVDGTAHLTVWNNMRPAGGLVVLPDGGFAGFGFDDHFLAAATARPIVEQLVATGEVRRAILGVVVTEVGKDDLLRQRATPLGTQAAIRVKAIDPRSAADRGGLHVNDLILAIAGQSVGDAPTFAAVIATRRGDTLLHVLRGDETLDLTVNLRPN